MFQFGINFSQKKTFSWCFCLFVSFECVRNGCVRKRCKLPAENSFSFVWFRFAYQLRFGMHFIFVFPLHFTIIKIMFQLKIKWCRFTFAIVILTIFVGESIQVFKHFRTNESERARERENVRQWKRKSESKRKEIIIIKMPHNTHKQTNTQRIIMW